MRTKLEGYEIKREDRWGYDFYFCVPSGNCYYTEVKCGSRARLSARQCRLRELVKSNLYGNVDYVVCKFDDEGNLLGDELCVELLSPYIP